MNYQVTRNTPEASNQSPIMFTAMERPAVYMDKHDNLHATEHKVLYRYDKEIDNFVFLNVVGKNYTVVQNEELFAACEKGLSEVVDQPYIIKDKMAQNGRTCIREYIFKGITFDSPESDAIVFRIVVVNGFGSSAIKIHAGAIDFFCTNGMITGQYNSAYAKHSSAVKLTQFTHHIEMAVKQFWTMQDEIKRMCKAEIGADSLDSVRAWLVECFSERLGNRLFDTFMDECTLRRDGRTLWALYSTLTMYASHNDGQYSIRQTSSDHEATTMLKRETTVQKLIQQPEFWALSK